MGELLKALMLGKALRGLVTDAELLAATAVLGKGHHDRACSCVDCDERAILGLVDDDEEF